MSTQRKYAPELETEDWKQAVNERLAAHRTRRGQTNAAVQQDLLPGLDLGPEEKTAPSRRIADRVAARYANAPSYSELLATEARNAARAAQRAVTAAQEAADAAQAFLEGLDLEPERPIAPAPKAGPLTVRSLPEPPVTPSNIRLNISEESESFTSADPLADATVDAAEPIPANLIEFPRQLVATRRVPAMKVDAAEPPSAVVESAAVSVSGTASGLRIYEVEESAAQQPIVTVYTEPITADYPATAYVDEQPIREELEEATAVQVSGAPMLFPAPIPQRWMAMLTDFSVVGFAFLSFFAIAGACTTHLPSGKAGIAFAVILYAVIAGLYHSLFLTLSEATPGMLYAQIGLCSFDDENLTRRQRVRRVVATVLAATPLGLGLMWALFDEERLGWQDRMSRSYQRSYSED